MEFQWRWLGSFSYLSPVFVWHKSIWIHRLNEQQRKLQLVLSESARNAQLIRKFIYAKRCGCHGNTLNWAKIYFLVSLAGKVVHRHHCASLFLWFAQNLALMWCEAYVCTFVYSYMYIDSVCVCVCVHIFNSYILSLFRTLEDGRKIIDFAYCSWIGEMVEIGLAHFWLCAHIPWSGIQLERKHKSLNK